MAVVVITLPLVNLPFCSRRVGIHPRTHCTPTNGRVGGATDRSRVKSWHAANTIDKESRGWVVQLLKIASMDLQQTAQDIDDR